jgi:nucleoid-associated protein YgaU
MRPTALLGLGGFALLAALLYGLWPSAEVPPDVSDIAAPPPAPRVAQQPATPLRAAAPDTVPTTPTPSPATASAAPGPATARETPGPAASAARSTTVTPATAPASAAMLPRFDVVRVGLRGSAVVAGRAAPGAEVLLFVDGGRELGRARADGRGEWVILPADPLPSGAWELSLRSRMAGEETAGPDAVVVVVPEAAPTTPPAYTADAARPADTTEPGSGPIAVLIPSATTAAAPRILQGPQVAAAGQARAAAPSLGMDSVDYEDGGTIRFAGSAPPGAAVRVYVGARHAGDAVADASGRWTLAPDEQPPVGRNSLRVDQVAASGTVAARVEVPFQRDALPADAFDTHRVVVQPGTNLWRIARASYGRGTHFTTIYQANRHQIRDPRMIFPGQIFDLPEVGPTTAVR